MAASFGQMLAATSKPIDDPPHALKHVRIAHTHDTDAQSGKVIVAVSIFVTTSLVHFAIHFNREP